MVQFKKCGQASTEYLIVIGISLLLLTPVILIGNDSIVNLKHTTDNLVARDAVDMIAEMSCIVNAQGAPAKITKTIRFPDNIISTTVSDQIIDIEVGFGLVSNDLFRILDFNVSGSLPVTSGHHKIVVEAISDGVNISEVS